MPRDEAAQKFRGIFLPVDETVPEPADEGIQKGLEHENRRRGSPLRRDRKGGLRKDVQGGRPQAQ